MAPREKLSSEILRDRVALDETGQQALAEQPDCVRNSGAALLSSWSWRGTTKRASGIRVSLGRPLLSKKPNLRFRTHVSDDE